MNTNQSPSRSELIFGVILVGVLSGCYLGWHMNDGWIAHDEGLLGHMAERTLQGETPHTDFQDVYTGLLTHLHANTFQAFGISLASLRIPLLLGATLTSVVWFLIATRFVGSWVAGTVALGCLAWSFPNYFAPLPSWYILMLATWTTWALLKFHETTSRGYLLLAGAFSGISILFKIVGLYLVAASLFSIWISRSQRPDSQSAETICSQNKAHVLLGMGLAAIYILLVLLLIRQHLTISTTLYFVLPVGAAMAALIEVSTQRRTSLRNTVVDSVLYATSLITPLLLFALPYVLNDTFDDLWVGLFELPRARLDHAASLPPSGFWCLVSIPVLVLALVERRLPNSMLLPLTTTVALCGAGLIAMSSNPIIYQSVFATIQCVLPVICLTVWIQCRFQDAHISAIIVTIVAASIALTQYPYSTGVYFCYCAPLAGLAFTAVVGNSKDFNKPLWIGLSVVLTGLAVMHSNYSNPRRIGIRSQHIQNTFELQTNRGGLKISNLEELEYNSILDLIAQYSKPNDYILAGPDCPQFYFLSGRKNPTPYCYDLFGSYQLGGQPELEANLKAMVIEQDIQMIILNQQPEFSQPYSQDFLKWIDRWGEGLPTRGSGRFAVIRKKLSDQPR